MKAIYSLMGALCPEIKQINNNLIGIYKPPILIFLFLLCFVFAAKAQEVGKHSTPVAKAETNFVPLKVGDTLPVELRDLPLRVAQDPSGNETIRLADYRDKLLILDFWATWCSVCVTSLPKLYAIKEKNRADLNVLLVNAKSSRDSHSKVDQFLEKRKAAYQFTSLTEDTVLTTLFPHKSVPFYVWVYNDRVLAFTNRELITQENISNALEGQQVESSNFTRIPYDSRLPLFLEGNGGDSPDYIFKSLLTRYVKNLPFTMRSVPDENGLFSRITFTNSSVLTLFRYAYPEINTVSSARLLLSVQDSTPFNSRRDEAWNSKHRYNYETQFSKRSKEEAQRLMRKDLQKLFRYQVTSTEQEMDCWVVTLLDKEKLTKFSKDLEPETNLYDKSGLPLYFINRPLSDLLNELERLYKAPFIDETGLKESLKLDLPANLLEVEELQASLRRQGLILSKQVRKVSTVILSDNK